MWGIGNGKKDVKTEVGGQKSEIRKENRKEKLGNRMVSLPYQQKLMFFSYNDS